MKPMMNTAAAQAKSGKADTASGTATTTYEGRTEVNVKELLERPNVKKILEKIASTPLSTEKESITSKK